MALTPQWLDELRSRTTLSSLIAQSVKLTRAGREYKACCPFHSEKSPSFTVNDEKGFYHCFGCSAHGDAIRWMTEQRGLSFIDAVKELADAAGMDVPAPDPRAAKRAEAAKSLRDVTEAAARWFADQLAGIDGGHAREYLKKRGISDEVRRRFALGFAPDSRGKLKAALSQFPEAMLVESGMLIDVEDKETYDRFRGRLMIPIRDPRGRVIAFGGRILGAGEPKYLNSPDTPLFDKGRTLYNLDLASPASRKTERIIVVEGYMDVIALSQAGMDDVVAPLGTALTEEQIDKLWLMVPSPILCFDGDTAGRKAANRAARRALPRMKENLSLSFATLPLNLDPADIVNDGGLTAFNSYLDQAVDISEFIWRDELRRAIIDTPSGRTGLKANLEKVCEEITDTTLRSQFKKELLDRFYDAFGFKAKNVNKLKSAINSRKSFQDITGVSAIHRAVLLGLMRHPLVLHNRIEDISLIDIPSPYYHAWRIHLIDIAMENQNASEDLVEQIMETTDVSPLEKRAYNRDLAFSFYFPPGVKPNAERDLNEVIDILLHEAAVRESAALALKAFQSTHSETDWTEYARLSQQINELAHEREDVLERAQVAA